MRPLRSASHALAAVLSAAAIAACGTSEPTGLASWASLTANGSATLLPLTRQYGYHSVLDVLLPAPFSARRQDYPKSWISPEVRQARQIYFAGDTMYNSVRMFRLPDMKLLGTLTVPEPMGMCSDDQGNVYIVRGQPAEVAEYSHTGVLKNSYKDPYGGPLGCAVNPRNGDLAVTNNKIGSYNYGGSVLIYSSPSSRPKFRRNPAQMSYSFAGYDSAGHLWVDGFSFSGAFIVSDCSSAPCKTVNITGGVIYFAGAVQWDEGSRDWIIFDQMCNGGYGACSYPVSNNGVLGSRTVYNNYRGGPACDITQGVIGKDHFVVGSDFEYCGYVKASFGRWSYPLGGKPRAYSIDHDNEATPDGAAISVSRDARTP